MFTQNMVTVRSSINDMIILSLTCGIMTRQKELETKCIWLPLAVNGGVAILKVLTGHRYSNVGILDFPLWILVLSHYWIGKFHYNVKKIPFTRQNKSNQAQSLDLKHKVREVPLL
jgi:hypothetical protein